MNFEHGVEQAESVLGGEGETGNDLNAENSGMTLLRDLTSAMMTLDEATITNRLKKVSKFSVAFLLDVDCFFCILGGV